MLIFSSKLLRILIVVIVFIYILISGFASIVHANNGKLDFVYGTNHFDGKTISSSMIPPIVDTVYLISDVTSMVAPKYTKIYYWQITNEYKADWETANFNVDGTLEILQGGKVVHSFSVTDYVIQYDVRDKENTTRLYIDSDAVKARKEFEQLMRDYRDNLYIYYQEYNKYKEELAVALEDLKDGKITEADLPKEPEKGSDITLFSTEILRGFPVKLPCGEYEMRLRLPDGSIQPDSEKHLVMFNAIREGIGYQVVTRERWTKPEESHAPNDVIYTIQKETIFLEPYEQNQYNELYFTRMNNPQDKVARKDHNIWVFLTPIENAVLIVKEDDDLTEINFEDFYVKQLPGKKLGYEIKRLTSTEAGNVQPSFSGYEYLVSKKVVKIWLNDSNGKIFQESERDIRVINTEKTNMLYVFSSVPLLLGMFLIIKRKIHIGKTQISEY